MHRTCIVCGKPMKFIRTEKLPEYDYFDGVFDRFECPCGNCVTWAPVPTGPTTATEASARDAARAA